MKILIDVNLSPTWVQVLEEAGHTASHWSTIGSLNASDREILLWAKASGYLLFTHDLDFEAILAATETEGPSVIQISKRHHS
jgi:predicted nuclease of predicted toxin-antitoxin system